MSNKHSHYFKDVSQLDTIDVYRVLGLFGVTDPCLQHALKKVLVAGGRGGKDISQDVQEAIDSLQRWQEMRDEESGARKAWTGLSACTSSVELPLPLPPAEAVMGTMDPWGLAYQWFTTARSRMPEDAAMAAIGKHMVSVVVDAVPPVCDTKLLKACGVLN